MNRNRTSEFLEAIDKAFEAEIPQHVLTRTRQALMDYIGVTFAGRAVMKERIESLTGDFCEAGRVYPVGVDMPLGLNDAAFINGLNAHALDFDDGTNAGIIHLGSPVFSALFAMVQRHPFDMDTLVRAAVIGYETEFTMARSIQPQAKKRGWHATGICGVLGAAAALSHALGFDKEQRRNAFSIAAVSATGSLKVLEDGSDLKPYNVAKTAMLAVIAVEMTRAGFRGADDALSGIAGYLTQMHGTDEVEFRPPILDGTYAVEKAYIKPYAACRYCHPSIDIALDMFRQGHLSVDEVERIDIRTYDLAVKKHDHTEIPGSASAKMSIPYNFAVTYLTGKTGMDAFADDVLGSDEVRALTRKVSVTEDEYMNSVFPGLTIAEVELTAADGRKFSGRSELPKGEPENPLSQEEAEAKFRNLASYGGVSEERIQKIIGEVMKGHDIDKLLGLLH